MLTRILSVILWVLLSNSYAQDIFEFNQRLGRGVNFGNALEAPSEGSWGMTLETSYFELVKEAGFDSIRLPVSWTTHTNKEAPYAVDKTYMDRVQWAVDEALSRGLNIIVNVHHYDELNADPTVEEVRYLAIWQQIAEHFKDYPDTVYFELLNEPHDVFNGDAELWNTLLVKALMVVRESNPTRAVIIGPNSWNAIGNLAQLKLPDDPNLIVTVHFYDPFTFTHQGAEWVNNPPPVGTVWTGGNRRLSTRWQNQSWDTKSSFIEQDGQEYLQIEYQQGWAGYYLHSYIGPKGYTQMVFKTDQDIDLNISCNADTKDQLVQVKAIAGQEMVVDLASCGDPKKLKDVFLQNASDQPKTFLLELLEFRGENRVLSPFEDQGTAIRETFDEAFKWAQENNRPIFLGEFGAYSKADMESRVRWTTFVRTEIEKHGFSWAYWEFGAGFGIYDREKQQWNTGLLEALVED